MAKVSLIGCIHFPGCVINVFPGHVCIPVSVIVADRLQRRTGIKQLRRNKMSEIMRPVDIIRIPDLIFLAEPLHLASKCACLVCAAPSVFKDILIGSDGIPADVFSGTSAVDAPGSI